MNRVEPLLREVARKVEPEVQRQLRGFFGGFLRAYLPQTWVFRTEDGVASLLVDAQGRASVRPGEAAPADVTVEVGLDRLRAALRSQGHEALPPGPFTVVPHTAKGRTAFDYLRRRLGF